ncbi:MAG: DUF2802 domain-containing protein [Oleiphilaceae bacterium]|nr:DUF2802 domain-containing protein [Oleiphilaceae bacterium]
MWSEMLVPSISGILVCLMAIYVVQLKRATLKAQAETAKLIDSLSQEIQGISHGSMGVGRKALQLEKELETLKDQFEAFSKNDPAKVSYSEASRLVELGAGIEDLMNSCGISRPEAELVSALTGKKSGSADIPVLTSRE